MTYSATDVTDGNLPFPTTASVTFNDAPASGCASGMPTPAPGYVITPVATGLPAGDVFFGDISFSNCPGAEGPAFDAAGNMYVSDFNDGNLYKFPSAGGVASPSTELASIGVTLDQPAFSGKNLWVVRAATASGVSPAGFYEVDTSTGSIINNFTGIFCSTALAADPLTGDLFSGNQCNGLDARLHFSDLTAPPTFSVYATMPADTPGNVSFLPKGTMYVEGSLAGSAYVAEVSGTNVTPTTVTQLSGLAPSGGGIVALGFGSTAQSLILNLPGGISPNGQTTLVDVTTNPPSISAPLTVNSVLGGTLTVGPDGCVYGAQGNAVYKLSKADGTCPFTTAIQPASLALTPAAVSPNPAQGTAQTFTASFHYVSAPAGTPVFLQVTGANPQTQMVNSDANGQASFSYTAAFAGIDTITRDRYTRHHQPDVQSVSHYVDHGRTHQLPDAQPEPDQRDGG